LPHWANIASSHATLISVKVLAKSTIEDTCNETITIMIMTLRIGAAYHFLFFVISIVFEVKEMMMEKKRQYPRLSS